VIKDDVLIKLLVCRVHSLLSCILSYLCVACLVIVLHFKLFVMFVCFDNDYCYF